jgi:hypothetical protein
MDLPQKPEPQKPEPARSARKQTRSRQPYAAAVIWLMACTAGVASAAGFDEKLQAPRVKTAAVLRSQVQSFAARAAQVAATAPQELVTNSSLWSERFDLTWQIQRAMDAQEPLGDLSALGLESTGDGAFRIHDATAPQWRGVDVILAAVLPRTDWANLTPQLISRGFRPEDVNALQDYVAAHDVERAMREKKLPVAIGFSRTVKKLDKLKRPIPDDLVLSFMYQRQKAEAQARRDWAAGALDSLDRKRARILVSFFTEAPGLTIWAPSDLRAGIAELVATMRLGDFEQRATDEARGVTP